MVIHGLVSVRQVLQYKRGGCSWLRHCSSGSTTQGVIQYKRDGNPKYLTEVDLQFVCEPERRLKKNKGLRTEKRGRL